MIGDTSWERDEMGWMDSACMQGCHHQYHLQQVRKENEWRLHCAMNESKSSYLIRAIEYTHALHINQKSSSSSVAMMHVHIPLSHSFLFRTFNYLTRELETLPDAINDVKEESRNARPRTLIIIQVE